MQISATASIPCSAAAGKKGWIKAWDSASPSTPGLYTLPSGLHPLHTWALHTQVAFSLPVPSPNLGLHTKPRRAKKAEALQASSGSWEWSPVPPRAMKNICRSSKRVEV